MKVLFLTNIPSPYRVDFFNELGKFCDLTVTYEGKTATDRDAAWVHADSINYTAIYLNGIRTGSDNFLCLGIVNILRQHWDKIIVGVYSTPTSMIAIEYMKLFHIKFFLESDGGFIKQDSKLKYRIKKHFISAGNCWLSTGKATTDYLVHYGADRLRCHIYPFTSVSTEDLNIRKNISIEDKIVLKSELGFGSEINILSIGQFIHRKGFDILLKSVEGLQKSVNVYIVGGHVTEEFQNLKNSLGLYNVHFIDFQSKSNIIKYYLASDIFILPTREDIWGLVVNEAMSMGLPVITTDMCLAGVELIREGENGFIIPNEDTTELQRKIRFFIENPEKIAEFGKNSFDIIKKYTIEEMARRHLEILQET